ncbi:hypothetical protein BTRA_5119 [Burkholderia thailandensis USAMRU Malaysia |uniref:Uncharacterized protein n=2 Tax=Burkholderia thailandensis TaxID=57975 RepID=Q2T981_BURTA|nr:hypothetical protein BTH_II0066 [Burkholderia thailandensis E264]AIC89715.1 hypothetical protein BTRA_5119 [Burkholderia thailandensis USAMRU Malaysia \
MLAARAAEAVHGACVTVRRAARRAEADAKTSRVRMETSMTTGILGARCASGRFSTVAAVSYADTALTPIERDGVTYVAGGIGSDEAAVFSEQASRYNLHMTFVSKTGKHLSVFDAVIQEGPRQVLAAQATGPFLYVRLPAGCHTASARDRHGRETKQVRIDSHRGAELRFYWEDPDRHDVRHLCTGGARSRRQSARWRRSVPTGDRLGRYGFDDYAGLPLPPASRRHFGCSSRSGAACGIALATGRQRVKNPVRNPHEDERISQEHHDAAI